MPYSALDFPDGQTSGIERDNFVVKARPTGLVFANDLRLELTMTITWNLNRQFAKIAFQRFTAFAVAGIAGGITHSLMLGAA